MKKPRALLIKKERYPFSFDILQQLLDIINLWNVRQGNIGYIIGLQSSSESLLP
jgi:hypothetical protein